MATVSVLLARKGPEVFRVAPSATFEEVAAELRRRRAGSLVVAACPDGPIPADAVVGIVSERDLVAAVAEHGADAASALSAGELCTREVTFTSPSATVAELASEMTRLRIRHLPVLDDAAVVGVVSIGDAVAWHLSELTSTTEALSDYVRTGRG